MGITDALLLGILQGFTEFLPISSSGHLILLESFLKLPVQDLLGFDVAVHFGTLLAIFVYFRRDFADLLLALWRTVSHLRGHKKYDEKTVKNRKMIVLLILCTIPAVLVGLFLSDWLEDVFRGVKPVVIMMLIVAVYFAVAEYVKKKIKPGELTLGKALLIGLAQAVAIIPGISRSGSTIATGLIQGIDRTEAARFSFLLGSVAITAATLYSLYKVMKGEIFMPGWDVTAAGVASSFIAGYAAVFALMKFLKKHTLLVFSAYLAVISVFLLIWF